MFCNKCGNQLSFGSKFCSKCGQPLEENMDTTKSFRDTDIFTLRIIRANQWFAVNPSIKVKIDEQTEYNINNGASINIPIKSGAHNIAFLCGIRTKIVNINITNNVVLNIKWNRITGSLEVE